MASSNTKSSTGNSALYRSGFTLIELLVVIAIIAILAAILFPVFGAAKNRAKSATCLSNLKQIGVAVKAYCNDYRDRMPVIDTLFVQNDNIRRNYDPFRDAKALTPAKVLGSYIIDARTLVCPSAVNGLPQGKGPDRWLQTYVFYGRDMQKSITGGDGDNFGWNQFAGQVQQSTVMHGTEDAATQALLVRDSKQRPDPNANIVKLPHGADTFNRLYADGHVAARLPEAHLLTGDF
ncbi:MAG: prepilin-type N-terminal cleavage/methylation domain-containing protein [Armatimonadetes bacterium]|nr:prepilin-type N-terminal cleavage/methylation domain-containing protein [Armatimonadota bacterium]